MNISKKIPSPPKHNGFVLIVALSFIIALTMIGVSMMDVSLLEQRMAGNYTATVTSQAQQDVILKNSISQLRQTYDYTDVSYPCQVVWHPTTAADSEPDFSATYNYTDVIPTNPCSIPAGYTQYQASVKNLTESNFVASYTDNIDSQREYWDEQDDTDEGQVIRFGDHDGDGKATLYTDSSTSTSWNSPVHLVSTTFTDRSNSEFIVARQPGPPILAAIYTDGNLSGSVGSTTSKLHDSMSSENNCGTVFGDAPDGGSGTNHVPGKKGGWIAMVKGTNSSSLITDDETQSGGGTYGTAIENASNVINLDIQAIFNELLGSAPYEPLTDLSNSVSGNRAWRRYFIQGDGINDVTFASGKLFSGLFLIDGGNPASGLGSTIKLNGSVFGLVIIVNAKDIEIGSTFQGALFAEDNITIGDQKIVLNMCSILYALQNEPMLILQSHSK